METELRLKLAARIRDLRKKHKYTQWELSDLSDVDYKHIQLLESKKRCDVKLSTRLCDHRPQTLQYYEETDITGVLGETLTLAR